jgi:uncharacterized protein (DUF2252 family)
MLLVDPFRLARRQIEIDRERTARFPHLFAHKVVRMSASPLALLRGSAPLFYELFERHAELREGPGGEGWLVGDAHIENFGAYRAGKLTVAETRQNHAKEPVVFDLNDFDDAVVGPWRLDVVRLLTSLILGGRELGADGARTLEQCDALLDAYVARAFQAKRVPTPPHPVAALVEKVRTRTRKAFLDARTELVRGERRFVRGPRYEALPRKLRAKAERAFQKYSRRLPRSERAPAEALDVMDAAFRVAGTGSLGALRVAVLVRGKGGPDGAWIFDMKAEAIPSASRVVRPPKFAPADRVCEAIRACLARPPRMIGSTRLRGTSMLVRRLAPQEDKLDLSRIAMTDLVPLAEYLGTLLGAAHRRGGVRVPKTPWNAKDRGRLLERAVLLAGIHEAMYLAYCNLVRR